MSTYFTMLAFTFINATHLQHLPLVETRISMPQSMKMQKYTNTFDINNFLLKKSLMALIITLQKCKFA